MKQVLVLGAGQSAPYLIATLLEMADTHDWFVTVGDLDQDLASQRVNGHSRGNAVRFDVNDSHLRDRLISQANLVVNMLSPRFQDLIAWDCVQHGKHMLSVSYRSQGLRDLEMDAQREGVLLLSELGLDPGIDHMSAMQIIRRIKNKGGRITGFASYGSGIPSHEQEHNPLRYVVTWNPRNVVMSAEAGAQYMEGGQIKIVPYHHVFHHTWTVNVEGVGPLEAYPNRDSLRYMKTFGLDDVHTMIRGTLRYPGWSETWARIVQLGLPNEGLSIPDLANRSYREVVEMFLPMNVSGPKIETRVARFLGISPTGGIMDKLRWLGLFSEEKTNCKGESSAAMLIELLQRKLPLGKDERDMVVLVHEMDVEYPGKDRPDEKITSTFVVQGEPGGFTAMSKTVGLPAALAAELLLTDKLHLKGAQLPTHPSIYEPILESLRERGMEFTERVEVLEKSK
ncbi:saccharopine dehydrogenase NADP-binding domain-containing protein [bacterium]|nr:saccharopine dehydrogenase NADP-binding domain-containing protein [bacterium]